MKLVFGKATAPHQDGAQPSARGGLRVQGLDQLVFVDVAAPLQQASKMHVGEASLRHGRRGSTSHGSRSPKIAADPGPKPELPTQRPNSLHVAFAAITNK